jgi:hypothetical protein
MLHFVKRRFAEEYDYAVHGASKIPTLEFSGWQKARVLTVRWNDLLCRN